MRPPFHHFLFSSQSLWGAYVNYVLQEELLFLWVWEIQNPKALETEIQHDFFSLPQVYFTTLWLWLYHVNHSMKCEVYFEERPCFGGRLCPHKLLLLHISETRCLQLYFCFPFSSVGRLLITFQVSNCNCTYSRCRKGIHPWICILTFFLPLLYRMTSFGSSFFQPLVLNWTLVLFTWDI